MELLLPSARRPRFHVRLTIHDLSNVPLVSGLVHVRWHLVDSFRAESRGRTDRQLIRDHRVTWEYEAEWSVRLAIDRSRKLSRAYVALQVYQETQGGRERQVLGSLRIDLAEHAGNNGQRDTRRYLLQDAKVNATLRLSISLTQLSGDTNFTAPELQKAQVFGGITGILAEGKEEKKKRLGDEGGGGGGGVGGAEEMKRLYDQEFYRDSITRRWQREAGELDPEDVIDDLFAGGDGWTHHQGRDGDEDEDKAVSFDRALYDREREEMIAFRSWTIDSDRVIREAGKRGYLYHQSNHHPS